MTFLDVTEVRQDDPKIVALHEILIRAYTDPNNALAIAGQAGIHRSDIAVVPKMRYTWWSILEETAKERQLRRLVHEALKDPTTSGYHDDIVKVLDIPVSELIVAGKKKRAPRSAIQKQHQLPTTGTRALLWPVGYTLKIRFLDGELKLRTKVERAIQQWVDSANLKLDFGDHPDAEIRISFKLLGRWAYIGTSCLAVPGSTPNLSYGAIDSSTPEDEFQMVMLHEFGHVLGLQHEHGNPASTLAWNKKTVYEKMEKTQHWTREMVDRGYFSIWAPDYFPVHKVFDRTSIMMYEIPAEFLRDGVTVDRNHELSPVDKQFIAALYPQRER